MANGVSNSLSALFGIIALDAWFRTLLRWFTHGAPIEYLDSAILLRFPSAFSAH